MKWDYHDRFSVMLIPRNWFPPDVNCHCCLKSGRWRWCHPQISQQSSLHVGDCSRGCTAWTGGGWAHSSGGLQCWALEWRRCDCQSELSGVCLWGSSISRVCSTQSLNMCQSLHSKQPCRPAVASSGSEIKLLLIKYRAGARTQSVYWAD